MRSFFAPANLWVNVLFRVHGLELLSESSAILTGSSELFATFFRRFRGVREPPYCPLRPEDLAILDDVPKMASVLPLQARPDRRAHSLDLQLQDGDATDDNGQPLVSTSETLLGRYKGIIKDAISSLPNDSGLSNPSTPPVSGVASIAPSAHNISHAEVAVEDRPSAFRRQRRKRTISHLDPGSGCPEQSQSLLPANEVVEEPTSSTCSNNSNSIHVHGAHFDDESDFRGGNDMSLSRAGPVLQVSSRPNAGRMARPQAEDFLAQPPAAGFLRGFPGMGTSSVQMEQDARYHHIDMSAFDLDMLEFLGDWGIEEP